MNKKLGLFLSSLFVSAAGIGFLFSAVAKNDIKQVDAADQISYVSISENETILLGEYPQNICDTVSANDLRWNGAEKRTSKGDTYYIYHNKKYAILDTGLVDTEGSDGRQLSNQQAVNSYNGKTDLVFEFSQLEWQLLKKNNDNTAYLITTNIIDRKEYHYNLPEHVAYNASTLKEYIDGTFKDMAFTDADLPYFANAKGLPENIEVSIPSRDDVGLDTYADPKLKQASDYAILKNLTSHSAYNHGTGVPYLNAGYWTSTLSDYETDRVDVCWAKVAISHCLMDDNKIGFRPIVLVNYKEGGQGGGSGGGGGTTPTNNTSQGGGNVALGLGIAFTILGGAGLITFFVLWSKKLNRGKPPVWMIASIAASLVVSIVGVSCLAGGMSGGGGGASGCFETGYYVQTGTHSGGGIVQVGSTAWLFKADGTCSYTGYLEDTEKASDFSPDNYMTGTYTVSGSTLTIKIPERNIQNFGPIGGTYTYTVKNCKFLYKNSTEAYHWVRGE